MFLKHSHSHDDARDLLLLKGNHDAKQKGENQANTAHNVALRRAKKNGRYIWTAMTRVTS